MQYKLEFRDIFMYIVMPLFTCVIAYISYNEKDKTKMKYSTSQLARRTEIEAVVDMKLEAVKVEQQAQREDLDRIEGKLDRIIDLLLKRS